MGCSSGPPLPSLRLSELSGQRCHLNTIRQSHSFLPGSVQSRLLGCRLHFMQLCLGINSVFSKRHKTVSLETSSSFPTLEVFAPKTILSAPMVLSVWQARWAVSHLSNSETKDCLHPHDQNLWWHRYSRLWLTGRSWCHSMEETSWDAQLLNSPCWVTKSWLGNVLPPETYL